MGAKRLVSRRTFLRALVGCSLIVVLATGLGYRYRRPLLRRYLKLTLDESSDAGTLSADEFQVFRAVFEVIVPKPAPSAENLLDFINLRTSSAKGYYREYEDAAALLNSRARKRFSSTYASLDERSRESILREVLDGQLSFAQENQELSSTKKMRLTFQLLFSRPEMRFQAFVFLDLLEFYWLSGTGWAVVGYSSYPGIPKDPRAYTVAPDQKPVVAS
jgi:hypothetical protein